jgi:hypothetical protein
MLRTIEIQGECLNAVTERTAPIGMVCQRSYSITAAEQDPGCIFSRVTEGPRNNNGLTVLSHDNAPLVTGAPELQSRPAACRIPDSGRSPRIGSAVQNSYLVDYNINRAGQQAPIRRQGGCAP